MMTRYLIHVWGDVEPYLIGPFPTDDARLKEARHIRRDPEEGDSYRLGGLFRLDIDDEGRPEVGCFTGGEVDPEFDEEEDDASR